MSLIINSDNAKELRILCEIDTETKRSTEELKSPSSKWHCALYVVVERVTHKVEEFLTSNHVLLKTTWTN